MSGKRSEISGTAGVRKGLIAAAASIAVCCALPGFGTAVSAQDAAAKPGPLALKHGLQGMRFTGSIGLEHQADTDQDVLTFDKGAFSSAVCMKYGYPPAPYWVRRDSAGLHFLATLENPENGTIRFEGVFDGREMRATALWTKERWYWTIEQTLVFRGRPVVSAR